VLRLCIIAYVPFIMHVLSPLHNHCIGDDTHRDRPKVNLSGSVIGIVIKIMN